MFLLGCRAYPQMSARIRMMGVAMMQSAIMIALSRAPGLMPASRSSCCISFFMMIELRDRCLRGDERCRVVKS